MKTERRIIKMTSEKENLNEVQKGVINSEVSEEMKKSYLDYAMSVIVSIAGIALETMTDMA